MCVWGGGGSNRLVEKDPGAAVQSCSGKLCTPYTPSWVKVSDDDDNGDDNRS